MVLPIASFVSVTVLVNSVDIDRFNFGTPMGVFEHQLVTGRQAGPYASLTEMVDAGFISSTEPYKWATEIFSQSPSPSSLLVGRRVASAGEAAVEVWQDNGGVFTSMLDEFNDATDANCEPYDASSAEDDAFYIGQDVPFTKVTFDYANGTAGATGVVEWEYWNGSAWAALTGVTDGTDSFKTPVADGLTLTFNKPGDWAKTTVNSGASLYFIRARLTATTYTTEPILDQGFVGGDATLTAALDEIEAESADSWYATNIETRTDTDILAAGAWMETRRKIGILQSDDPTLLTGTVGNIGLQLQALNYHHTALIYHGDDTEYLDGAWTGRCSAFDLDAPDGVGTWGNKQLSGVAADDLNSTKAANIWAANANLYGSLKGLSFTSEGKMASGRFIDITTTNHWLEARLEEEVLALLVGATTKIPYDQSGLDLVGAAIERVVQRGVINGHFNGDDSPPLVKVPLFSEVSTADKTARTARYIVNVTYKGAIQSVTITVNAQF